MESCTDSRDNADRVLWHRPHRPPAQAIFKKTPHDKQVMMFSATLSSDIRPVCKKFMRDVRSPAALQPRRMQLQTTPQPPAHGAASLPWRRGARGLAGRTLHAAPGPAGCPAQRRGRGA